MSCPQPTEWGCFRSADRFVLYKSHLSGFAIAQYGTSEQLVPLVLNGGTENQLFGVTGSDHKFGRLGHAFWPAKRQSWTRVLSSTRVGPHVNSTTSFARCSFWNIFSLLSPVGRIQRIQCYMHPRQYLTSRVCWASMIGPVAEIRMFVTPSRYIGCFRVALVQATRPTRTCVAASRIIEAYLLVLGTQPLEILQIRTLLAATF